MNPQVLSEVKCPRCDDTAVLGHADLDILLENDSVFGVVCLHCEHKWPLSDEEKSRLRSQRREWKQVIAR